MATTMPHRSTWLTTPLALLAFLVVSHSVAAAQDVAILYADSQHVASVVTAIDDTGSLSGTITTIDVASGTPDMATLVQYEALLVYNLDRFDDAEALGDVLAEYVDAGGGVVLTLGTNVEGEEVLGRFNDDDYHPFTVEEFPTTMIPVIPTYPGGQSHPILDNVGQLRSARVLDTTERPGSSIVAFAYYDTGEPVAAENLSHPGKVVALNMYAPPSSAYTGGWSVTSDGDYLLADSLVYVAGTPQYLHVEANTGFTLDRGDTHVISNSELRSADGVSAPEDIEYTLVATPVAGELQRAGGIALNAGQTFSQQDIDNGDISYEHDGSSTLADEFIFDVSNGTSTITDQTVTIAIDPGSSLILDMPGTQSAGQGETELTLGPGSNNAILIDYPGGASSDILELTLEVGAGEMTVTPSSGVTLTGANPGTLILLEGELADLNDTLAQGVTISVASGFVGAVTLDATVEHPGVTSDTGSTAINFDATSGTSGRSSNSICAIGSQPNLTLLILVSLALLGLGLMRRRQ